MKAVVKQLDKIAGRLDLFGNQRLDDKLGEWKRHYDDTEKYQGRAKGLATAQRRSSSADRS